MSGLIITSSVLTAEWGSRNLEGEPRRDFMWASGQKYMLSMGELRDTPKGTWRKSEELHRVGT
jgi:hypothetical protein